VNQVDFEGHALWAAVDDLRQRLIEADQAAGPEQWQALDQMRFDQLQYVIRGMRAHRPPPEAAAYALATMDRFLDIVSAASAELGAFLIDRSEVHLHNAARLVDQALEGVGRPGRPQSSDRRGPPRGPAAAAPVAAAAAVSHPAAGGSGGGSGEPPHRAPARHAKSSPSHGPALAVGIGILVLAVAVGTYIAFGATTDSDSGAGCTSLRVVTASSYRPALDSVADSLASGDDCVRLEVTTADGRNADQVVDKQHAQVWITDDAAWLERYEAEEAEEYSESGEEPEDAALKYVTLATSPVLFASSPATAERIKRAGGGWAGLAVLVESSRPVTIVTRDPASTGDGLAALGGLGDAVWDSQGMDASALLLNKAYRHHRTAFAIGSTKLAANQVALVPEHVLRREGGGARVITAPGDQTVLMRYSWYATNVDASDPAIQSARAALLAALTEGPSADAARAAAHLRDVQGQPPATQAKETWVGGKLAKPNPVLDAHKVEHVFATWYAADRKADVLVVVDISGSMAAPAPGSGAPLIRLVRQNVKHLARELPQSARLGVWGFGSRLRGARDYIVVDPFGPLSREHRRSLNRELDRLRARDTGTGLYDTVLAAYRSALADARPGVGFQVMVFTDGLNQDDPRAHSAGQLRQALAAADDPEAPVGLTVVQVGKQSPKKLQSALRPIGGEVVSINSAKDVVATFIHLAAGGLH
jgi:Ca-activated chloride channel homolog